MTICITILFSCVLIKKHKMVPKSQVSACQLEGLLQAMHVEQWGMVKGLDGFGMIRLAPFEVYLSPSCLKYYPWSRK